MLGKVPVPGRPIDLDYSGARAYCACSGCRWGLFGRFLLSSVVSRFFLPLSGVGSVHCGLKFCLKGPLSPRQPTKKATHLIIENIR